MFIYWNSGSTLLDSPPEHFLLYGNQTITENMSQIVITKASILSNLTVVLTAAPGLGNTRIFTIRQNGADTTLSVTLTGAASMGVDSINTVAVSQFDLISASSTGTGNTAVGIVSVQVV